MAGRVMKTIFDVIGRDSGASATGNRVAKSLNVLSASALRSKAALGGASAALSTTQNIMAGAMKSMMIGGGFLKIGSSLTNVMDAAKGHAADLEYEIATLRGISGATAEQLDRLANAAQKAGIETQFTPTEAVQGLQALAQQGFTTEQQLKSLNSVLMLSGASGGKVPLNEAAKLTTQTLKAFGLGADKSAITVDRLVKTTTMSGLAIEELAEALQNGAAGAISMGIGLEETMATMGLIKNIIPSAAMAGSAFQILTTRMSNPMIQNKIKRTLGVDVIDKATGQYREFSDLMIEISDKLAGMKEGERGAFITEAFGARAQKGIAAIFTQLKDGVTTTTGEVLKGRKAFEYYLNTLDEDKVKGFAEAMNDMKLDTLHGQMELLSGSLQTFQIELGKGSAAISKSVVKYGLKAFNVFLEFFMKLPQPVKAAVSGFLSLSGTLIKVIGGFFILKGLMGLLGVSLSGILLTIGKVLLLAVPLTMFFSAIGIGAYGLFRMVKKNFGGAGDEAASMFEKIKLAYRGVTDLISGGALSKSVIEDMKKAKFKGVADFIGTFGVWLGRAKRFFQGVIQGFDNGLRLLKGPWNDFKIAVSELFGIFIGEKMSKGKANLRDWEIRGKNLGSTFAQMSKRVLEILTNLAELGQDWSSDFTVEGAMEDLMEFARTMNDIVDAFRWLIDNNPFSKIPKAWELSNMRDQEEEMKEKTGNVAVFSADFLTRKAKMEAEFRRYSGEGIPDNAYGFEGDVSRFVRGRARRLETLQKGGHFKGQRGQEQLSVEQEILVMRANEAAEMKAKHGDREHYKKLANKFDEDLKKMELAFIQAAEKAGNLKGIKVMIGEKEFGRLVNQAGLTMKEDSYDDEFTGPPAETVPVVGG